MVCSFTGHRQIKEGHRQSLPRLLLRAIEFAYSKGCRTFLAGGAIGFDTEAALTVIKYRVSHSDVSLILVLPCLDQSRGWTDSQRSCYEYTLKNADEVVYISEEYTPTCMRERNRYLAEKADLMIAYADRQNSGAAQTVRMAMSRGKEIYNLFPSLERDGEG